MSATREDVARRAGVSTATVSYVINDGPRPVSEAARTAVLRAVEELGYRPNHSARDLARRGTRAIAFVTPDNANPFFAELAHHVEDVAFEAGLTLILCNSNMHLARERAHLALLVEKRVDGIILVTSGLEHGELTPVLASGIPLVLLNREIVDAPVDMVLVENVDLGRQATDHLLDHGHTRVACLAGPPTLIGAAQRVRGYREALLLRGLRLHSNLVIVGDFTYLGGYKAALKLLSGSRRPSALFASNDQMALGALRAARELGLAVPAELAIVGADDTFVSAIALPALTTVAQPAEQMGRLAANMLLERVRQVVPLTPRPLILKAQLHVRESCGCASETPRAPEVLSCDPGQLPPP